MARVHKEAIRESVSYLGRASERLSVSSELACFSETLLVVLGARRRSLGFRDKERRNLIDVDTKKSSISSRKRTSASIMGLSKSDLLIFEF